MNPPDLIIKSLTCKKSDWLSCSVAFSFPNESSLAVKFSRLSGKYLCLEFVKIGQVKKKSAALSKPPH